MIYKGLIIGESALFKISDLAHEPRIVHFDNQGSTAISVSENSRYRWLTIDDAIQSVMDISETHRPILPHLSAVLLALRYKPAPIKLLELGLGGGSMQRFFHYYFPHSDIISIENNPKVLALFDTWFSVAGENHSVLLGDAEQDICNYQQRDLIFVDLFSKSGSPDFVSTLPFYQNCLNALHDEGVLVINLIAQYQMQMELTLDLLRQLNLNLRTFAIPGYQNKIVFAARQELPAIDYDKALNELAQKYQLDLNAVVAMM